MSDSDKVFQLIAGAQSYDWGKIGTGSKVATYAAATPHFQVDASKPYAELWMGTHPSCPSKLLKSEKHLADHLAAHPELLGQSVIDRFGTDLPFLFKVLAIEKALSIQAHPDKPLAQRLHKERPDVYKDGNHKPEMAIAISPFSGFCGFLPPKDIVRYIETVPELASLLSQPTISAFASAVSSGTPETAKLSIEDDPIKLALREVFGEVMKALTDDVHHSITSLVTRYKNSKATLAEAHLVDLVLTLNEQFPGDVGILCSFLLNVVKLDVGQAVFLKADEPHAYISGDIIETMATSDNVVRAGLTPKLRDVPTLLSMLTYTYQPASEQVMPPQPWRSTKHTTLYDPPIDEFSVLHIELGPSQEEIHEAVDGPSIFIITANSGGSVEWAGHKHIFQKTGEVYFVGAGTPVTFRAENGLTIYRAFVEAA